MRNQKTSRGGIHQSYQGSFRANWILVSGRTMIKAAQPTQPLFANDRSSCRELSWLQQLVFFTLMETLPMIKIAEFVDQITQLRLGNQNIVVETFFPDRPMEPFQMGVQVRGLWRQTDRFDPARLQCLLKPKLSDCVRRSHRIFCPPTNFPIFRGINPVQLQDGLSHWEPKSPAIPSTPNRSA